MKFMAIVSLLTLILCLSFVYGAPSSEEYYEPHEPADEVGLYLQHHNIERVGRQKRWLGILRGLATVLRGSRYVKTTRSGSRVTRHYERQGNVHKDFKNLNPSNPKVHNTPNGQVHSGSVGNHRVTARDHSSHGKPTLEIHKPGGTKRKIRYD